MISVVTPSLNQSQWLRLAVASVADQSEVSVEHIVQDALSSDGTRDWLGTDPRVCPFFEKDAGMYDAVNRGIKKSRGEICGQINCDEQYLPGVLQRVSAFFETNPDVDVIFGDALIVDSQGQALAYRRAITPRRSHIHASHLNVFTCAMFFRRRIVEAGHWLDPRWKSIGDAVWIDGMLAAGLRMRAVPELFSVFTLTGQNLSSHNPVSTLEQKSWEAERGTTPSSIARMREIALHRIRKLFAGAYRTRKIDYEIYTLHSRKARVRFHADSLGGIWPEATR